MYGPPYTCAWKTRQNFSFLYCLEHQKILDKNRHNEKLGENWKINFGDSLLAW